MRRTWATRTVWRMRPAIAPMLALHHGGIPVLVMPQVLDYLDRGINVTMDRTGQVWAIAVSRS